MRTINSEEKKNWEVIPPKKKKGMITKYKKDEHIEIILPHEVMYPI